MSDLWSFMQQCDFLGGREEGQKSGCQLQKSPFWLYQCDAVKSSCRMLPLNCSFSRCRDIGFHILLPALLITMKCVSGRWRTRPLPLYLNCPRIREVAFLLRQKKKKIHRLLYIDTERFASIAATLVIHNIARYSALWTCKREHG